MEAMDIKVTLEEVMALVDMLDLGTKAMVVMDMVVDTFQEAMASVGMLDLVIKAMVIMIVINMAVMGMDIVVMAMAMDMDIVQGMEVLVVVMLITEYAIVK